MEIRDAAAQDLQALLDLKNHAVRHLDATWTTVLETLESTQRWLEAQRQAELPVLVACDSQGGVIGYGSYGPYRPKSGYRFTISHSVYVRPGCQGGGAGSALLQALITRAERGGYHVMVAGVDGGNDGSIAFHQKHGFEISGRLPQAGTKFGRWLDLVLMTRVLNGDPPPEHPAVR
ncbi:N-acetyltransferase family protein [Roseibium denhamense]|uniref:Phosphinothricin acetyltransferase n=1 Tax=Roseibium denhamense TaxID=76305 RepID=A0ABY1NZ14_9HYPH|nr:GNAT family N-acetyltransferase [Roseibium denhamense]MTI05141.1 N-acetyltransferase family protein [Roseibium denhamense]SMP22451.1 phosphinothricin acetyltransferase [Roseibium denhamense]